MSQETNSLLGVIEHTTERIEALEHAMRTANPTLAAQV